MKESLLRHRALIVKPVLSIPCPDVKPIYFSHPNTGVLICGRELYKGHSHCIEIRFHEIVWNEKLMTMLGICYFGVSDQLASASLHAGHFKLLGYGSKGTNHDRLKEDPIVKIVVPDRNDSVLQEIQRHLEECCRSQEE